MFKYNKHYHSLKKLNKTAQNSKGKCQLNEIRFLTTTFSYRQAVNSNPKEWQTVKNYNEIPTMSSFTLIRNFLPGGKYCKFDSTQFLLALKEDLGSIYKLPGAFGQTDMIVTHNVQDFETLFRNESVWPKRPGMEALNYHRSVYRKNFFQGTEGLLATHGEQWGSFRSAVNPILMQHKNVRLYLGKMSQVNKEFIERPKILLSIHWVSTKTNTKHTKVHLENNKT